MLGNYLLFPPKLNLARLTTPLVPLPRLSKSWGDANIWVKRDDLTGSLLSGNKVRKLEYVLKHAQDSGVNGVVTAGAAQSNHCRATAIACAQLGLTCYLMLRESKNSQNPLHEGNCFLSGLAGAEIVWIAANAKESDVITLMEDFVKEKCSQGELLQAIPIGASNEIGLWGYIECAGELKKDFSQASINPDWIVCATGSSGTQAGLALGAHVFDLSAKVLGMAVCDNSAYFERRICNDVQKWIEHQSKWTSNTKAIKNSDAIYIACDDRFIGNGYGKVDSDLLALIKDVAEQEGLLLDPVYTAKAMMGVKSMIKEGKVGAGDDVVFIHTGGIFGLFPYAELLAG